MDLEFSTNDSDENIWATIISKYSRPQNPHTYNDYEWNEIRSLHKYCSPLLFFTRKKQKSMDDKPQEIEKIVKPLTKNQKRRLRMKKLKTHREYDLNNNGKQKTQHFIASLCCGKEYCHHYAYERSNFGSFVEFRENFYNRNHPDIFLLLQRLFNDYLLVTVRNHPRDTLLIEGILSYYTTKLHLLKISKRKCIFSLIDLIHTAIDMDREIFQKTKFQGSEVYDFFYEFDTAMIIVVDNSDLVETKKNSLESFVYQSIYYYMCNYLYGIYMDLVSVTGKWFYDSHCNIVNARPTMGGDIMHLGTTVEILKESRLEQYRLEENYDQLTYRKYFYDQSYTGDNFQCWIRFQDAFRSGASLAHFIGVANVVKAMFGIE